MMTKPNNLSLNEEARQTHASSFRKQVPNLDRRGPVSLVSKHVSEELFQLQLEQFRHDEIYHREISRLTVHQRLNHMALHFSKYAGQIAEICHSADEERVQRTITDIFVIGLSSANTLNMRVADQIGECQKTSVCDLAELGAVLAKRGDVENFDSLWFLKALAISSGRMAKGCESIDHLEPFPFNERIKESVVEICKTALIAASLRDLDLASAVRTRLAGVKERLIFHGHL